MEATGMQIPLVAKIILLLVCLVAVFFIAAWGSVGEKIRVGTLRVKSELGELTTKAVRNMAEAARRAEKYPVFIPKHPWSL